MAVEEITQETEFDKGWSSADETPPTKVEAVVDPTPIIPKEEKPVEQVADESAAKETVDDKKVEEVKADDTLKDEVAKPDTSKPTKVIEVDDNSETYKQRWKSQQGIVKSEMTKRELAERRALELEAEVARLKTEPKPAEATPTVTDEIDKLEEQYMDALSEYDKPLAIKIRKQIDDIKFRKFAEIAKQTTNNEVTSAITYQKTQNTVEQIVQKSIEKYPFLDHTNDKTGNPYAIRLVKSLRDDYFKQGMRFEEALEAAVAEVAPMFESKPVVEKVAEPVAAIDDEKVKSTVAVSTKNTPIKVGGKQQRLETFEDGWNSVK